MEKGITQIDLDNLEFQQALQIIQYTRRSIFLTGKAGTGKSTLIAAILSELRLESNQFYAMSYTGAASMVMRTKGFPYARTIHSYLYECIEVPDNSDPLAAKFGAKGVKKKYIKTIYIY